LLVAYRLEKLSREVDEAHAMQSLLDPAGGAMKGNPYLFAAYAVTWIIHIAYISTIVARIRG